MTLENAAKATGYAHLRHLRSGVHRIEDLGRLPVLTRSQLIADPDAYRVGSEAAILVNNSDGTSGSRLRLDRSGPEIAWWAAFLQSAHSPGKLSVPDCIHLSADFNGGLLPMPYPGTCLNLNVQAESADSLDLLLRASGNRVILVGLESQLRVLTYRLLENNFEFQLGRVCGIVTYGDLLTPRLRRWYAAVWRVPILNRYGLTEALGTAGECEVCGAFHFEPFVVPEIVDPRTHDPITEGIGILLVTTLFPFVQVQPFIRYSTGDIVEVAPTKCYEDEIGFFYKGRSEKCIFDSVYGTNLPLALAGPIYEILDEIPDVASSKMFPATADIWDHRLLGHLQFKLTLAMDSPPCVCLAIALRYNPADYPRRVAELSQIIRSRFLEAHPALKSFIDERRYQLSIKYLQQDAIASFMPDEKE